MSQYSHRRWNLIIPLVRREVAGRYRGSLFGLLWAFFSPVLMLLVYVFIFGSVFKLRWMTDPESKVDFAIALFTGLIVYGLFADSVSRAPNVIVNNVSYVKKVVFPLEILPVVAVGAALFHALVSVAVLLLFYLLVNSFVPWTVIFLPAVLAPLVLLAIGATWLFASLGVFFRDISQIIGIFITALLFLSPIFYPTAALPEDVQAYIILNPLTLLIEQAREVLIWGRPPDWSQLAIHFFISGIFAYLCYAWFQKTRRGFADVL